MTTNRRYGQETVIDAPRIVFHNGVRGSGSVSQLSVRVDRCRWEVLLSIQIVLVVNVEAVEQICVVEVVIVKIGRERMVAVVEQLKIGFKQGKVVRKVVHIRIVNVVDADEGVRIVNVINMVVCNKGVVRIVSTRLYSVVSRLSRGRRLELLDEIVRSKVVEKIIYIRKVAVVEKIGAVRIARIVEGVVRVRGSSRVVISRVRR